MLPGDSNYRIDLHGNDDQKDSLETIYGRQKHYHGWPRVVPLETIYGRHGIAMIGHGECRLI